jgi:hypothetical protein
VGFGEHDVSSEFFDRSIRLGHVVNFLSMAHDDKPVAHLRDCASRARWIVLGAQLLDVLKHRLSLAHRKRAGRLVEHNRIRRLT